MNDRTKVRLLVELEIRLPAKSIWQKFFPQKRHFTARFEGMAGGILTEGQIFNLHVWNPRYNTELKIDRVHCYPEGNGLRYETFMHVRGIYTEHISDKKTVAIRYGLIMMEDRVTTILLDQGYQRVKDVEIHEGGIFIPMDDRPEYGPYDFDMAEIKLDK